jgi:UDP-N-acetylmuramate dehydrogenase
MLKSDLKIEWDKMAAVLSDKTGVAIECEKPLAPLNTFGTGGPTRLFAEVSSADQMAIIIRTANELNLPFFILGGGSNILVSDKGFDGLIIKNSIMGMRQEGDKIISGTGEKLQDLINFAAENGLTGLEFASGIWGTVGGAVFGNAGAYGSEISAVLDSVQLVDKKGVIREEPAEYLKFSYRYSILKKTGEVATRACFALNKGKKEQIAAKVKEIILLRNDKLPIYEKSAGCFFKNIPDENYRYGKLPAGKLLEEVGAKEVKIGGAEVFQKHANIIINAGSAASRDIRRLAEALKKRVRDKFGIELTEEITYLGTFEEDGL